MNLLRSDQLFHEAARSSESYDRLLQRLQRARKHGLISILVIVLIAIAAGLAAFIPLARWLRSPTFPQPPTVEWLNTWLSPELINLAAAILAIKVAAFLALVLHHDLCIKMLILSRSHQASQAAAKDSQLVMAPPVDSPRTNANTTS